MDKILFVSIENAYIDHILFLVLPKVVANLSRIYPRDMEAPAGGVDDMTKLSYLHEPGVLENLKIRYELNEIYVSGRRLFLLRIKSLTFNS